MPSPEFPLSASKPQSFRRRALVMVLLLFPLALLWPLIGTRAWQPRPLFVTDSIPEMTFSPTEPLLAVTLSDADPKRVQMWDTDKGELLWQQVAPQGRVPVAFSPDGKVLATGTEGVDLWDAHTGRHLKTIEARGDSPIPLLGVFQFTPDGKQMIVVSNTDELWFLDVAQGRHSRSLPFPLYDRSQLRRLPRAPRTGQYRQLRDFAVSPDAKTLVGSLMKDSRLDGEPTGDLAFEGDKWICDAKGQLKNEMKNAPQKIVFSPDNHWIAAYSYGESSRYCLQLWDARSGKMVREITTVDGRPLEDVRSVVFSRDGTRLYAGILTERGGPPSELVASVDVWDLTSGKTVRHFEVPQQDMIDMQLSLSPDDSKLAIRVSEEKKGSRVALWRVK